MRGRWIQCREVGGSWILWVEIVCAYVASLGTVMVCFVLRADPWRAGWYT